MGVGAGRTAGEAVHLHEVQAIAAFERLDGGLPDRTAGGQTGDQDDVGPLAADLDGEAPADGRRGDRVDRQRVVEDAAVEIVLILVADVAQRSAGPGDPGAVPFDRGARLVARGLRRTQAVERFITTLVGKTRVVRKPYTARDLLDTICPRADANPARYGGTCGRPDPATPTATGPPSPSAAP